MLASKNEKRSDLVLLVRLLRNSLLVRLVLRLLLLMHNQIIEPRVLQRIMSTDTQLRTQLQHSLQQINSRRINRGQDITQILGGIHLEIGLILGQLRNARPRTLRRRTHDSEDAD